MGYYFIDLFGRNTWWIGERQEASDVILFGDCPVLLALLDSPLSACVCVRARTLAHLHACECVRPASC